MKQINVQEFNSFQIISNGWRVVFYDFKKALNNWRDITVNANFVGVRYNGSEELIDSK